MWLFRTNSSVAAADDPTLGWAAVAEAGVEVRTFPGDHRSLMRPPHVAALATAIAADLRAAKQER
jgi:thioesterase domain-containing protein